MTITVWYCEDCGINNFILDSNCAKCGKPYLDEKIANREQKNIAQEELIATINDHRPSDNLSLSSELSLLRINAMTKNAAYALGFLLDNSSSTNARELLKSGIEFCSMIEKGDCIKDSSDSEPLQLSIQFEDNNYIAFNDDLGLLAVSEFRDVAIAEIQEEFSELWNEYVNCPDEELTEDAKKYKAKLKRFVELELCEFMRILNRTFKPEEMSNIIRQAKEIKKRLNYALTEAVYIDSFFSLKEIYEMQRFFSYVGKPFELSIKNAEKIKFEVMKL